MKRTELGRVDLQGLVVPCPGGMGWGTSHISGSWVHFALDILLPFPRLVKAYYSTLSGVPFSLCPPHGACLAPCQYWRALDDTRRSAHTAPGCPECGVMGRYQAVRGGRVLLPDSRRTPSFCAMLVPSLELVVQSRAFPCVSMARQGVPVCRVWLFALFIRSATEEYRSRNVIKYLRLPLYWNHTALLFQVVCVATDKSGGSLRSANLLFFSFLIDLRFPCEVVQGNGAWVPIEAPGKMTTAPAPVSGCALWEGGGEAFSGRGVAALPPPSFCCLQFPGALLRTAPSRSFNSRGKRVLCADWTHVWTSKAVIQRRTSS